MTLRWRTRDRYPSPVDGSATRHSCTRPVRPSGYRARRSIAPARAGHRCARCQRLLVTVRNGKTGFRVANSMSGAVARYQRLRQRYPDAGGEDFIFLPHHTNRATVARIFARQFNVLLDETGLKHDPVTDTERSVYCPRHTAICMRIILSHGNVNIFNLAKNAGTGVRAD